MSILYEYRPTISRSGRIKLVPQLQLSNQVGFQSIFGFPKCTAQLIRDTRSMVGLATMPLYADKLYLDFDDADTQANEAIIKLTDLEYSFLVYNTGGRGYHIVLDLEPIEGLGLPFSMRSWVQDNVPGADLSIYKTSGLIRLPGTTHIKTGRQKRLISKVVGRCLELPRVLVPPKPSFKATNTAELDDSFIGIFTYALTQNVLEGGRNDHANKIAFLAQIGGHPRDEARELVLNWNTSHCRPMMELRELDYILTRLYKRSI